MKNLQKGVKAKFQFHKGTIKTMISIMMIHIPPQDFNSIKVRLKHGEDYNLVHLSEDFNSIKVRLKRADGYEEDRSLLNFNSIKVRLKLIKRFSSDDWKEISIP